MLSRWPIRYKLGLCAATLVLIVALLSFSSFRGIYAYRELARSISLRSVELPLADRLAHAVGELRYSYSQVRSPDQFPAPILNDPTTARAAFRRRLAEVRDAVAQYRLQLSHEDVADPRIGDTGGEWQTLRRIEAAVAHVDTLDQDESWVLYQGQIPGMARALDELYQLAVVLPSHLHQRMHDFRDEVRTQYRTWIALAWLSTILTAIMLLALLKYLYTWIFGPLRLLIHGSRRVAAGDFQFRIRLSTHDEMAELAAAMNRMTHRFCEIRDDLDAQVRARTREVVRSEQLASVGFLAAGVAHEINNPLASIAWSAESLEARLHETLHAADAAAADAPRSSDELDVLRRYLRRIQDEAFRCKGITERLLDFSRLGDVQRQDTELRGLVEDVIEMVRHLGCYRQKQIVLDARQPVRARVNAQEIKQVVLNLITNALDSLDAGGVVQVALRQRGELAELQVTDNGCGMTDEVLAQLFEPFFTRRRHGHGHGTGLGLSIAWRIIDEHGGSIEPYSEGPGRGSRFRVTLPTEGYEKRNHEQAA